jgi:hypothetical protein
MAYLKEIKDFPIEERIALVKKCQDHYNKNLFAYFNPGCRHERCAWDLLNCDACLAYTKEKLQRELDGLLAEDADKGE